MYLCLTYSCVGAGYNFEVVSIFSFFRDCNNMEKFTRCCCPRSAGLMPRAEVAKLGHSVRYHVMAKNCFKNLVDCSHYDPSISVHR